MEGIWYFVINPISGKGKGLTLWDSIHPLLQEGKIPFEFGISEYHQHTIQLITEQYQKGTRNFIGLGGDGTLNEIVNGIFNGQKFTTNTPCQIGLFPIGTGNDWIKNHQPLTLSNLIPRILKSQSYPHDVGIVSTKNDYRHYFLNVAGGGLDGQVVEEIGELVASGKKNGLSYIKGTLRALFSFQAPIGKIKIDNNIYFEGSMLLAAGSIGQYFGSGMLISPNAQFDNGTLDITIVKDDKNWKILPQLFKLFNGKIATASFVNKHTSNSIFIESNKPIPLQADGEYLGKHVQCSISVLKHAILILK